MQSPSIGALKRKKGAPMRIRNSLVLLAIFAIFTLGYIAEPRTSVTAIAESSSFIAANQAAFVPTQEPDQAVQPIQSSEVEIAQSAPQSDPAANLPETASGLRTDQVQNAKVGNINQGLPYTPSVWPDYIPARQIPIIEYSNGVSYLSPDGKWEMTAGWFRDEIFWLKQNGFRTITPKELIAFLNMEIMPPQGSIVLKFLTDAHTKRSDFTNVIIPILQSTGFTGNLFAAYENVSDQCDTEKLCWPELIEWNNQGLLTVGSEGLSDFNDYWNGPDAAKPLAEKSKQLIEKKLGRPIFFLAYNSELETKAWYYPAEAGYQAGFARKKVYREQSLIPMGSVRFGDADRYALPSYMPYSSEKLYPLTSSFNGMVQLSFQEMIWKAVGGPFIEKESIATTNPSTEQRQKTWTTIFNYCAGGTRKEMDGGQYLDKIPFLTDVSAGAQKELNGFVEVRPTCYFIANNKPRFIVLHYTEGYLPEAVNTFRSTRGVASHYIVDIDGSITQLVPENQGTYHVSCSGSEKGACLPSCLACKNENGGFKEPYLQSIGIEIVNPGPVIKKGDLFFDAYRRLYFGPVMQNPAPTTGPFLYKYEYWGGYTDQQLNAVRILINDIETRWKIEGVVGHSDIQYKVDPGPALATFLQVLNSEVACQRNNSLFC